LTEVLRNGARALLAQAIEAEVAAVLANHNCTARSFWDTGLESRRWIAGLTAQELGFPARDRRRAD
jgi:hypothetical protein